MIKISVMYPNTPGSRFDHDYYRDQHMPMVKRLMGDACLSFGVDRGLAGGTPDAPAAYEGDTLVSAQRFIDFGSG